MTYVSSMEPVCSGLQADSLVLVPVQNYITAIIIFLVVEMLMTWGFYGMFSVVTELLALTQSDYENRNGANVGSKVLMIVVAILNAARNSFSFFLLLIVCMGYGVVKPSLGQTMIHVRWLAAAHFVFGLIYSIASLTITPDSAGMHYSSMHIFIPG
jgi:Lung seven transmembrane receptor